MGWLLSLDSKASHLVTLLEAAARMVASDERPTAPRFDAAEADDIKVFYHNLAYRVNRQVINQVKLQVRRMSVPAPQAGRAGSATARRTERL